MPDEMSIEDARAKLGDLAKNAHQHGTVTYLTFHRRRIAAIVPLEDTMTVSVRDLAAELSTAAGSIIAYAATQGIELAPSVSAPVTAEQADIIRAGLPAALAKIRAAADTSRSGWSNASRRRGQASSSEMIAGMLGMEPPAPSRWCHYCGGPLVDGDCPECR